LAQRVSNMTKRLKDLADVLRERLEPRGLNVEHIVAGSAIKIKPSGDDTNARSVSLRERALSVAGDGFEYVLSKYEPLDVWPFGRYSQTTVFKQIDVERMFSAILGELRSMGL